MSSALRKGEAQQTLMKRNCQRQLAFGDHVMRRYGLENLVVTGGVINNNNNKTIYKAPYNILR